MPIGATENLVVGGDARGGRTMPTSQASDWQTAIAAGGVDGADNAGSPVTNWATQVTGSTSRWMKLNEHGCTYIAARMKYQGTPSTSPTVVIWGRKGDNDAPQRLYNKASVPTTAIVLTAAAATDITDGTYFYTEVVPSEHVVDCMGCDQFLVTVTEAYAVSDGNAATAVVQIKPF